MAKKGKPRGTTGRRPTGVNPGEKVSDYPRFAVRLPDDVRGELQAASGALRRPAWRVVIDAIRAVSQGRSFLTRKVGRILQEDYIRQLERRGLDDSYDLLTDREREILQLIAEGKTNKEVASLLTVSLTTVETHRTHILQKLGLHSIPELILYAVRKGIIS